MFAQFTYKHKSREKYNEEDFVSNAGDSEKQGSEPVQGTKTKTGNKQF